jgi:hypothetical protein
MPKGEIPVPYIVALILALIVIAIIAYMFFTRTGPFSNAADASVCKSKEHQYCFEWGVKSSSYQEDKRPKSWDEYAPGCSQIGITGSAADCKASV